MNLVEAKTARPKPQGLSLSTGSNIQQLPINFWTYKLPAPRKPKAHYNKKQPKQNNGGIIHIARRDRQFWWEADEGSYHRNEQRRKKIADVAHGAEIEGSFFLSVFEKDRACQKIKWWNSFIFAAFGAAILVGSPLCGWVADRTSNRSRPFYVGLLILAAATIFFGLAKASWVLLVSRLCQGLSAAIVYTVGLALLVDTVGRDNIGQWMGTALSSSSFGLIISPLLGGTVYAKAGYMAVFAMAISLIIVDILMRLCMIEKKTAVQYKSVEFVTPDSGLYGTFTDPQLPEHEQDTDSTPPSKPYRDHEHARLLENGSPQKKSRMPTIIVLLGTPRLVAAIYAIFVNVSILAAFDGVLPLYVQSLFHWDSLAAGLVFLCIAIPALTGPLVGKLSDKVGPRWIAVAGCILTAPPLILLRLVTHDSTKHKVLLCGLLVCCGFTLILIVSPVVADLSAVVEEKERSDPGAFGAGGAYAQAFALFNCSMAAATLFGPVVAGALIEHYDWGVMTAAMGVFVSSGAVPALLFTGGWIFAKDP